MAAMLIDRRLFFVTELSSYVGATASEMWLQRNPVSEMQKKCRRDSGGSLKTAEPTHLSGLNLISSIAREIARHDAAQRKASGGRESYSRFRRYFRQNVA